MSNNKQSSVVQLIIQALDIECKSRGMNVNWDMYLEMEKKQIILSVVKNLPIEDGVFTAIDKAHKYYNETYGGNNEHQ
jgi:uncharacterized 2Fe-2S/4Fe-4S cluster protein (DUF4445 family)